MCRPRLSQVTVALLGRSSTGQFGGGGGGGATGSAGFAFFRAEWVEWPTEEGAVWDAGDNVEFAGVCAEAFTARAEPESIASVLMTPVKAPSRSSHEFVKLREETGFSGLELRIRIGSLGGLDGRGSGGHPYCIRLS